MGIFLKDRGGLRQFFKNCHIFTYECPNGSGVGAIDRSDPLGDVFDQYHMLEVLRKIFMDEVWAVRPQKMTKMAYKTLIKGQKSPFLGVF